MAEAQQQRRLPHVAEVGAVLPMSLEEERVARVGIHPGIEGRQRIQRPEHEMPVVHHAVRMPVGLGLELVVHLRLVTPRSASVVRRCSQAVNAAAAVNSSAASIRERPPGRAAAGAIPRARCAVGAHRRAS